MESTNYRRALDVSALPEVAFGHRNVSWLGNIFYLMIEGTILALMVVVYFYLRTRSMEWPPAGILPPDLRFGVANGIVFLVSLVPARWVQVQARRGNVSGVRIGLMVLLAFEVITMVLRGFEFTVLHCGWTQTAYGSAIWTLLGLHAGHLATEFIETLVVTCVSFTKKMEGMRLADVGMNSNYWYFVVGWAVVIDVLLYGTTRLL